MKLLFEKRLTPSDHQSGRLIVPKRAAELHFPALEDQSQRVKVTATDPLGHVHCLYFRFWANSNSRMYILEGLGDAIRLLGLSAGDTVTLSRDAAGRHTLGVAERAGPSAASASITAKHQVQPRTASAPAPQAPQALAGFQAPSMAAQAAQAAQLYSMQAAAAAAAQFPYGNPYGATWVPFPAAAAGPPAVQLLSLGPFGHLNQFPMAMQALAMQAAAAQGAYGGAAGFAVTPRTPSAPISVPMAHMDPVDGHMAPRAASMQAVFMSTAAGPTQVAAPQAQAPAAGSMPPPSPPSSPGQSGPRRAPQPQPVPAVPALIRRSSSAISMSEHFDLASAAAVADDLLRRKRARQLAAPAAEPLPASAARFNPLGLAIVNPEDLAQSAPPAKRASSGNVGASAAEGAAAAAPGAAADEAVFGMSPVDSVSSFLNLVNAANLILTKDGVVRIGQAAVMAEPAAATAATAMN